MPITIQPKQPIITLQDLKSHDERKADKLKQQEVAAEKALKVEMKLKAKKSLESLQRRREKNKAEIRDRRRRARVEFKSSQKANEEVRLARLFGEAPSLDGFDLSSLESEDISEEAKSEIVAFVKLCSTLNMDDNRIKILETTQYIDSNGLWDDFPTIRAKLTWSNNRSHRGIEGNYYRIAIGILGSENCGTSTYVIKSEKF